MNDDRIKPTAELRCTETCPSYNAGTCMVDGYHPHTIQNPGQASGEAAYCKPATDAIGAVYRTAKAKPEPARQEYRVIGVVGSMSHEPFVEKVNDALADGWVLYGGTQVVSCEPDDFLFMQALVREVREEGEQ